MIQQDLKTYFDKDSPALRQEVLSQFDSGKSGSQIAKNLGINDKKFYRLLPKLGIINPNPIKLEKNIKERIKLRKQGASIIEIAKLQNVSDQLFIYL